MKQKKLLVAILLLIPVFLFGQELMVNSFDTAPADTNYWAYFDNHGGQHYGASDNADSLLGWITVDYVTDVVQEGTGSMLIDWSAHNIESWGGYTKLEHWHPDSNGVYDWSAYDSVSFWYYNAVPQSDAGQVHLRLNLHDVSDSPDGNKTYDVNDVEYYYSFHYILDNAPGWNRIVLPLKDGRFDPMLDEWGGGAFNRTGWSGIAGNDVLDKDKIKGFSLEFSIGGAGEGNFVTGSINIDHMALTGFQVQPIIFFNGKTLANDLTIFTWGQSTLEVEDGAGATEGTNAIKWVQGDEWANGWTGAGFSIDPAINMTDAWQQDSLRFKMKVGQASEDIRWQFEDGTAKVAYTFSPPENDGAWHQMSIALSDFDYVDGTTDLDTSAINNMQIMSEGNSVPGNIFYIDDLWTGDPVVDVVAPDPPTAVSAAGGTYYNLVIWQDVAGEGNESYTVYASRQPITDVTDPSVDVVASGIGEDTQSQTHWLVYPLNDMNVDFYYAVDCTDEFGNVSDLGMAASATTNMAKGIATISLNPPANFTADGDLSEWDASGIMPFVLKPETHSVPTGAVDDSLDLKATVYMAIDDDYLYVAADVVDDVYSYTAGNWWDQDAFQIFIGLYDQRGATHTSINRGTEPDYILYAIEERFHRDYTGGGELYTPADDNYFFTDFGGTDYVVEVKIPLDSLVAEDDVRFTPENGMRIPLDLYFHDRDAAWEGNLGFSPLSTDFQWQSPSEWFYTWIGDTTDVETAVLVETEGIPRTFSLNQNYPNPFNPETTIEYALGKAEHVSLAIYNVVGQKILTLVDERKDAGQYMVRFNAKEFTSGIYFYRIQAGDFTETRKMILMK